MQLEKMKSQQLLSRYVLQAIAASPNLFLPAVPLPFVSIDLQKVHCFYIFVFPISHYKVYFQASINYQKNVGWTITVVTSNCVAFQVYIIHFPNFKIRYLHFVPMYCRLNGMVLMSTVIISQGHSIPLINSSKIWTTSTLFFTSETSHMQMDTYHSGTSSHHRSSTLPQPYHI